ncbi:MAG: cellulase family glycosylhydrolase [Nitrososphaera sp.]
MRRKNGLGTLLAISLAIVLVVSVIPASYAVETFKTFDGNDKIDVPNAAKLQLAKFIAEVRFRIQVSPAEQGFLVSKGSTENGNDLNDQNYALSLTTARKVTGGFKAGDDSYHYLTSNAISLNTWHVAKLIYDGSILMLQIDGSTVATKTVNKNADKSGTGPLRIGANANALDNFFVGDMDYVKVVDRSTFTTVYNNGFGSGNPAPINCLAIPVKDFKGVVFIDNTLIRDEDGGPSTLPPTPPGYVEESMRHIKSNGFNAIRVPYYWETYVYNPTTFMAEIDLIAKTAQAHGICVVFSNFHYYTTSFWQLEGATTKNGKGFPSFVVEKFPVKNDDYKATAGPFWDAFLSNNFYINGTKVWDVQFGFMSKVINKVKGYSNVAGFEIINEPHLFNKAMYDKLGNYHTYMAKKMRTITDKKIFFDRETAWGFTRDPTLEYKIVPQGVSKLVYAPQLYAVPTPGSNGMMQIERFKNWSQQWGTEVMICEWGADNKADAEAFLKAFKANGFGWTAYSWKNTGSSGLGITLYESDSVPATDALKILVAAMKIVY